MPVRVRCYANATEARNGIVTRIDVADDRFTEANELFMQGRVFYWPRQNNEREDQSWPGHMAGTALNDRHLADPPANSRPELDERQDYARANIPDPLMGDIPLLDRNLEPDPAHPWRAVPGAIPHTRRGRHPTREDTLQQYRDMINAPAFGGGVFTGVQPTPAPEPVEDNADYPELNLNSINPEVTIMRADLLPPFKIDYETIEEVALRLRATVILVKDRPFYVHAARNSRTGFILTLEDADGDRKTLPFSRLQNARSARPGYVTWRGQVCYLTRRPARINQQGMTSDNVWLIPVGKTSNEGTAARTKDLLELLTYRKPKRFSARMVDDLLDRTSQGFRLSNSVAVYRKDTEKDAHRKIWVEYRGRSLAPVKDSIVLLKDTDKSLPWITTDLEDVGIRVA